MIDNTDRYLLCLLRSNGDIYKQRLFDDLSEALDIYLGWRQSNSVIVIEVPNFELHKLANLRLMKRTNIIGGAGNVYLIDLKSCSSSELNHSKYNEIKRTYKLNELI